VPENFEVQGTVDIETQMKLGLEGLDLRHEYRSLERA
jgi:hypothetical protein